MAKITRTTKTSRRMSRIASLKSKLRIPAKAAVAVKKAAPKVKAYASLDHLLNATALYQMGEYERASLAFQRAMSEEDAPEMLESLEDAQAELEGGDPVSTDNLAEETLPEEEISEDQATEDVDYLAEDLDVGSDEEDLDDLTDLEDEGDDLDLGEDEEAGSDISAGDTGEDFSVEPEQVEEDTVTLSRSQRVAKNVAALARQKQKTK